jgi:hypothetical protein
MFAWSDGWVDGGGIVEMVRSGGLSVSAARVSRRWGGMRRVLMGCCFEERDTNY